MRPLLIKTATITILLQLHYCSAQLFPWSNLKQYFDQKTKHGPGNGGTLNILPDFSEPNIGDRPYRNTDAKTSFTTNFNLNNNNDKGKHYINTYTDQPDTTTLKDITKQILKMNSKKNNHKINVNFDNAYQFGNNNHQINNDSGNNNNRNIKPILSINHDSTIRPLYNKPNNQNINIQLSDNPISDSKNNNDYDKSQDTIVITQKPLVTPKRIDNKSLQPPNSRISHKTVSILPSVSIKTSFVDSDYGYNNQQPIFVTSRPQNYPITQIIQTKIKDTISSSTHRPMKSTNINPFRIQPEYDRNPIFLPTIPPAVTTILPKPSQSTNIRSVIKPQKPELFVETVPSLAIAIKATGKKPFRITDNSGLIDYLVPPPVYSTSSTQLKPLTTNKLQHLSPIYGTKHYRKPYFLIKNQGSLTDDATEEDLRIMNEMSKLKPPEKLNENISSDDDNKKLVSNNKIQNYLNLLKEQEQNRQQLQQLNYDDASLSYENIKNVLNDEQQQKPKNIPHKKLRQNSTSRNRQSKRNNKYHNHKMNPSNINEQIGDYEEKDENRDPAASHINEQITEETGVNDGSHQAGGQRVEFQMHGQNGPKSYKFGFDTGKGHNRQFRYEERDKHGHVKGHYGYYDKEGKLQLVNYEADPHNGFKADPV